MNYKTMKKEQLVETIEKADKLLKMKNSIDGWSNIFSGHGIEGKDRRLAGQYSASYIVQHNELTNLYRGDGMAARIIDLPVHDMTRKWFTVTHDTEDVIQKELRRLRTKRNTKHALTWSELYGGSIILMGINDGGLLEDELNEENIQDIEFLRVYDRNRIHLSTTDLYQDPEHKKFGQVEYYNITPLQGMAKESPFRVHETRILRFSGKTMPEHVMYSQQFWGDSRLQNVYERVRGLSMTYANIERMVEEFIIGVLKMAGLEDKLEGGRESAVLERLNILDMSKHILNTYLIDADEESMERISSQIGGLSEAVTKLEMALTSSTGIPISIFFGDSPKGLNAGGAESEQRDRYYEMISGRQEDKMLDPMERLVYLIQLSSSGPTNGQLIDDWSVEFNPIDVPSEETQAKIEKLVAEKDEIYINLGVLWPTEITLSRYGGMEYSSRTVLSDAHLAEIENTEKILGEAAREGIFLPNSQPKPEKDEDKLETDDTKED